MPTHRPRLHAGARPFRRAIAGLAVACLALPITVAVVTPAQATGTDARNRPASTQPGAYGAPDETAANYYAALLRHTRWVETVWDESAGVYQAKDMNFAVVLGNAVLLTHGEYDAELAGVSEDTLREHTLATIKHFAATNRLVDPDGTWGRQLFWDSTFQSYFLAAGTLLWDQLDAATQANLATIATGQSRYTADLDFTDDPMSGSWTTEWPAGKYRGDTAQEEVGVYTQALAPGLAWAPDDADAGRWAEQLADWGRNAAGQPTADRNNPAVVAGKPVSSNTMHNIHDTYIVENHESFGPHYQSDSWRSGARNAIHFLLRDEPLPEILTRQPNSAELRESIKLVMSDQGEPFMPMVRDREFLYGRDVIPMAFLAQVLRDPDAARAEVNLAAALADYQAYAPVNRLTKFSGEPKYEPEARAEIAISYLLHVEAAESAEGPVEPTPQDVFFERLSGVRDFGDVPGLTVQQTADTWAGAVSRKGFVKFPWVPGHNSWLFYASGSSSFLYPDSGATVSDRNVTAYTQPRDGFEGTSSVFRIGDGYAGQVTLPTGAAVYASSGAGPDDASLSVRNLAMGGYAGLDGSREYTTAEGSTTVAEPEPDPADVNVARLDTLDLVPPGATEPAPVTARYVRMQGVQGHPQYGYSLYHLRAFDPAGDDVAAGRPATASSADTGRAASAVTDGSATTRWAVSRADRTRPDSWVQVDLGAPTEVARVQLGWESAAGERYRVQTSADGVTWHDAASFDAEDPLLSSAGSWLNVEGAAGFVVRSSDAPITVSRADATRHVVRLADGAAGPRLVEMIPGDAAATSAQAERAVPTADAAGVQVSLVDGYLVAFNLTGADVSTTVTVPHASGGAVPVFAGEQSIGARSSALALTVPAGDAVVLAPRATVAGSRGTTPEGVTVTTDDARTFTVTGRGPVTVRHTETGASRPAAATPRGTTVRFPAGTPFPVADLALSTLTFPASVLPEGMTSPSAAVDGDRSTAWVPGPDGRMVTDLGAPQEVGTVVAEWARGRAPSAVVSVSDDGLTFTDVGAVGRDGVVDVDRTARYVALTTTWHRGDPGLTALRVLPRPELNRSQK
ncbi:discoidin domain-containing protein [Promicromonospora sukumoe]|uniref:discoidin domain-containing protein n=1 Tax=Promicromonospora sukumoe TaxID=88382 RepID=UPI00037CD785|nr:discoidin domain-containing protein [Promicromonospora sukumoe]